MNNVPGSDKPPKPESPIIGNRNTDSHDPRSCPSADEVREMSDEQIFALLHEARQATGTNRYRNLNILANEINRRFYETPEEKKWLAMPGRWILFIIFSFICAAGAIAALLLK